MWNRGPLGTVRCCEDRPCTGWDFDRVEILGHRRSFADGDAVQGSQLAALGVVGVNIGAHLKQSCRFGIAQCLEARMLRFGQGGDMRFDVRFGAVVNEGHTAACPMSRKAG